MKVPEVCGVPTNTSTYFRQQGLGAISMILTSFFRGRLQALPKIWNKYRKHWKSCEFLTVWVDREVLAVLTISLQECPTFEGVFLYFHGQKKYKIWVSAHCSVLTKKLISNIEVKRKHKYTFWGQNKLRHTKLDVREKEYPTFEGVFSYFHGPKKYKIWVSAHCSVRTKKLIISTIEVKQKHKYPFGGQKKLRHTKLDVREKEEFPCFLYLIQIFGLSFG